MLVFTTTEPEGTFAFGRVLAKQLAPGDVICLSGDLGAGKTLLVQGIAAGLGVSEGVTSPTFTILQVYDAARLMIYHFDLYRLENPDDLEDIGFEEYVRRDGVAVIEWADKFPARMPDERLWLELKIGDEAAERVITIQPFGTRYQQLCEELKHVAGTSFRYGHSRV